MADGRFGTTTTSGGGGRNDPFGIPYTPTELDWMNTGQRNPDGSIPQNQPGTLIEHGGGGGGTYQGGFPPGMAPTAESSQLEQLIAMQEAERRAREARIASAMSAIDSVFGQRAGAFDQYADTSYDLNRDRLMDERGDRERQLKFALARAGTLGGSADVDRNAMLDDKYNQSLTEARSYADDQAARLRAQEDAARANLMGVASSGNVTGSQIGNMAQGALGATQSAMRSPSVMPNIGANMSGVADVIGQALNAIGTRRGMVPQGGQDQFSSFFPGRGQGRREEGTVISTG